MNHRIELGRKGEEAACSWLQRHGFTLLERNWRYGHTEIDVIAEKNGVLHIVEVKTRTAFTTETLRASLQAAKTDAVRRAAVAYCERSGTLAETSFDLVAVTLLPDGDIELEYLPDYDHQPW